MPDPPELEPESMPGVPELEPEPEPMPDVPEPVPDPNVDPVLEPEPELLGLEPWVALVPEPDDDEPVDEPVVELSERLPMPELLRSQAASEADRPRTTAVARMPFAICMIDSF